MAAAVWAFIWLLACNGRDEGLVEAPPEASGEGQVVALITIDTWRADHFGPAHTPNLWRLAESGERFTEAWSPMGLTSPAHATMFSGLLPWEHGLEANNHHGYQLREGIPWFPESLQGWRTGAFVSAYPAGPVGGLDRGWNVFSGPEEGERPGSVAVEEALRWLAQPGDAFVWVHLYEPHGPYQGSEPTEPERYASEVRRADAMLQPILDRLVERGARIVVASDHGEVLEEEACRWQHERSSSPVVLRVPLFRWEPSRSPSVRDDLVSLADVPSLLRGEEVSGRAHLLAQSGTCEAGCNGGCRPAGLAGRDKVVVDSGGQWIRRPGVGDLAVGAPLPEHLPLIDRIPGVSAPNAAEAAVSLEVLGYQETGPPGGAAP